VGDAGPIYSGRLRVCTTRRRQASVWNGGVSVGEARLPYEFILRRRLNGEAERELARRRSRRAEEV